MQFLHSLSWLLSDALSKTGSNRCDSSVQHSRKARLRRVRRSLASRQIHKSRGWHHGGNLEKLSIERPARLLWCADSRHLRHQLSTFQAWYYFAPSAESCTKWICLPNNLVDGDSSVFLYNKRLHFVDPLQSALLRRAYCHFFPDSLLPWRYHTHGLRIRSLASHLRRVQIQQGPKSKLPRLHTRNVIVSIWCRIALLLLHILE